MEMKDKLKQLRKEHDLTQAQLADAIFVSRSTVAKWENGLGLPSKDSMEALERLYGISREEVATAEPETIIVEKNRQLHLIGRIVGWVLMLFLVAVAIALPFALHSGNYGFTAKMAAGSYADSDFIDTGDYRIYYYQFAGDWEDGRHWSDLQGFRPVRKTLWGFTVSESDYAYRVITKDNYVVGRLYSIRGKNGYYNLIKKAGHYTVESPGAPLIWNIPAELITAASVTIDSEEYLLEDGFFFITQEPVEYFRIEEAFYDIE